MNAWKKQDYQSTRAINNIYTIILVFVFSIILGAFFPVPREILEKISELVKSLIEQTAILTSLEHKLKSHSPALCCWSTPIK